MSAWLVKNDNNNHKTNNDKKLQSTPHTECEMSNCSFLYLFNDGLEAVQSDQSWAEHHNQYPMWQRSICDIRENLRGKADVTLGKTQRPLLWVFKMFAFPASYSGHRGCLTLKLNYNSAASS